MTAYYHDYVDDDDDDDDDDNDDDDEDDEDEDDDDDDWSIISLTHIVKSGKLLVGDRGKNTSP